MKLKIKRRKKRHGNFKTGRKIRGKCILVLNKNHPRACADGYVREHILTAEKVLGNPLPLGAVVHHINKVTSDNRNKNLIICENDTYHKFLHVRQRAYDACGNVNWRKCSICKEYGDPENIYYSSHRKCRNIYSKNYRIKNGQIKM